MRRALEPGTLALAVARSNNAKIGDAATTYTEQRSCPSSCVFKDGGGCYAEEGPLGKFVTGPLNRSAQEVPASPEDIARAEADAIDAMEVALGRPLRLHTVGDCATATAARLVSAAAARYMSRGGGPVWTYTHAWREVAREAWGTVSVLASCETPVDVALAHQRGYATSMTRKKARAALSSPDDPDRRLTSRELIPRLLAAEPELTNGEIAARLGLHKSSVSEMRDTLAGRPRVRPRTRRTDEQVR